VDVSGLAATVWQIQSREFQEAGERFSFSLGEGRDEEDVNHLKSKFCMGNLSRRLVAAKLCEDGNQTCRALRNSKIRNCQLFRIHFGMDNWMK